jgi:tetratricopeptide (TPR) repeat protein
MADKHVKVEQADFDPAAVLGKARGFWTRFSKPITYGGAAIILLAGGYLAYKNFYKLPNEKKAHEAIYKAQLYYQMDSVNLALNGDNQFPGLLKVIKSYGGTEAGNLARYYAGTCYYKLKDYANAIKYLKEYNTDSKPVQARAFAALGDAYAQNKNNDKAAEAYEKAGRHFPEDESNSAEYLRKAGGMYETMGKSKEAIAIYKLVKEKYPRTQFGSEVDKFLAKYNVFVN